MHISQQNSLTYYADRLTHLWVDFRFLLFAYWLPLVLIGEDLACVRKDEESQLEVAL